MGYGRRGPDPSDNFESPALTVGIDATINEHQDLVTQILNEVYDIDLSDIERLIRSTVTDRSHPEFDPRQPQNFLASLVRLCMRRTPFQTRMTQSTLLATTRDS